MDEWNCTGLVDLFDSNRSGTLNDTLHLLKATSDAGDDEMAVNGYHFPNSDISKMLQISTCTSSVSTKPTGKRSILKKKRAPDSEWLDDENPVKTLKKVTFEVEKFAAESCTDVVERAEARARLAIKLGARPPKNPYINLKKLKEERSAKKKVGNDEIDRLSALNANRKNRKKKKKNIVKRR